jgi:hypothetical protein
MKAPRKDRGEKERHNRGFMGTRCKLLDLYRDT